MPQQLQVDMLERVRDHVLQARLCLGKDNRAGWREALQAAMQQAAALLELDDMRGLPATPPRPG